MFKIIQKISFQKFLFVFVVWVFIVALFTGDIKFEFGKENYSQNDFNFSLENLEDIKGELYYSPDNSWYPFYENISSIDNSLKIETYEFTEKRLKKMFRVLLNNGVDIKLIMEDNKYQQFQNTRKKIKDYFSGYNNFEIKSDKQMYTKYVHSKFALVDTGFWIQTANLTYSSFNKNREYFFYSTDTGVWNSLNTVFDKDWAGEKITSQDVHPNLLVCNLNCREGIENLLNSAKKSIIIQTQYIVDDRIWKILKEKSGNKNIDLKFIVSDTEANDDLLKYFGPGIARKFDQYYNHTKMILVDDKILLLGSMNLSDNSLDKNREMGILLVDKPIIGQFKKLFENDWRKSKYKLSYQ